MPKFSVVNSLMASLVLAISFSVPGLVQAQDDNEQMMNMVLQIQQLQDEIRTLRGQLEEQAYELENIKRRQRDQYLDLDQRISEMRDGMPVMSPGAEQPALAGDMGTDAAPQPAGDQPVDMPEVREAIDSESTVTGLAAPTVSTSTQQGSLEMEQAAYDEAFQALKELRYADAAEAFQSFIDQYPQSDLTDNAQYWLGESYYVTRNYDIALAVFQGLIDDYPNSSKAGDGLLKIGFTHYELKQWDQARAALEQVQQQYPNSTLARLAESRLRSMRLEGHY
jgi:tol-pal system protein YbgF